MAPISPITVFYDGACAVCVHQMHYYSSRDLRSAIYWVDIAAPDFSAHDYGLDPQTIKKYMYARDARGRTVRGVETFVWLWTLTGRRMLAFLFGLPVVREIAEMFYNVFSRYRYAFGKVARCDACRIKGL